MNNNYRQHPTSCIFDELYYERLDENEGSLPVLYSPGVGLQVGCFYPDRFTR
jgi:hypothetical protein